MTLKKRILSLFATVLSLSILVGCASSENSSARTQTKQDQVVIQHSENKPSESPSKPQIVKSEKEEKVADKKIEPKKSKETTAQSKQENSSTQTTKLSVQKKTPASSDKKQKVSQPKPTETNKAAATPMQLTPTEKLRSEVNLAWLKSMEAINPVSTPTEKPKPAVKPTQTKPTEPVSTKAEKPDAWIEVYETRKELVQERYYVPVFEHKSSVALCDFIYGPGPDVDVDGNKGINLTNRRISYDQWMRPKDKGGYGAGKDMGFTSTEVKKVNSYIKSRLLVERVWHEAEYKEVKHLIGYKNLRTGAFQTEKPDNVVPAPADEKPGADPTKPQETKKPSDWVEVYETRKELVIEGHYKNVYEEYIDIDVCDFIFGPGPDEDAEGNKGINLTSRRISYKKWMKPKEEGGYGAGKDMGFTSTEVKRVYAYRDALKIVDSVWQGPEYKEVKHLIGYKNVRTGEFTTKKPDDFDSGSTDPKPVVEPTKPVVTEPTVTEDPWKPVYKTKTIKIKNAWKERIYKKVPNYENHMVSYGPGPDVTKEGKACFDLTKRGVDWRDWLKPVSAGGYGAGIKVFGYKNAWVEWAECQNGMRDSLVDIKHHPAEYKDVTYIVYYENSKTGEKKPGEPEPQDLVP